MSASSLDSARSPSLARARGRRRPWWRGGSSLQGWHADVLGWGILALGAGLLAGGMMKGVAGTVVFWVALVLPVGLAYRRSIPRGLLRFRPVDLLYAVVLGGILRLAQGGVEVAFGGSGALPSYPTIGGTLPSSWWLDLLGGAMVAPVIEEFFFRGLILVVAFTLVRRLAGNDRSGLGIAGFVAVGASAGLFVISHVLVAPVTSDAVVSLALLGVVSGALVVFTGRIWPAILLHAFFNATGVALSVAGTLLG